MKENYKKENKIKAFNFILDEYYMHGFGTMTKSDLDLLFFTVLNKYSKIEDKSDYALSKILKITQARVRNLKIKDGLRYTPIDIDQVKKAFLEKAEFARTESDGKRISIPIFDPNIFIELENIIERENGYVEAQLNPKIFTIRIDQFINLLISFQSKEEEKEVKEVQKEYFKKLKHTIESEEKFNKKLDSSKLLTFNDLQKQVLDKGVDFGLDLICDAFPGGTFAKKLATTLINKIKDN
ncbi:MAG: hypothetical protein WD607_01475 [Candidatus Paceibacterota bacterium]